MLLIRKEFFEAIRRGRKTTTLRWWRWPRVRPGSVHTVRGLGRVLVEDVRCVSESELTEADALADGFESLRALRLAIEAMYPPAERDGRKLYLVQFTLLGQPPSAGGAG